MGYKMRKCDEEMHASVMLKVVDYLFNSHVSMVMYLMRVVLINDPRRTVGKTM